MLTPMSIMSLDQGKEFARQEMMRLHAEPCGPPLPIAAREARSGKTAGFGKWLAASADVIGSWLLIYAPGARRWQLSSSKGGGNSSA